MIGKQAGSTTAGVLIGAAVGGTAGAVIGHQMDQQAKELKQNIPGARVERVGEGIQVTFDSGLLFGFNSDRIQGAAQSNLDALAASLNKYPDSDVLIVGHTDDVGSSSYNQDLSERRADAACHDLFELALRLGGTVTGEHGIGWLKRGQLERQLGPLGYDLHTRIKRSFDPKGLLNPGKKL